jgi:pimeloyl-ACP methyl ester carboxylesterase
VLISSENSRILAERIPDAKLMLLEPAGHCFWLEQPEQSHEAILAFLQKQK